METFDGTIPERAAKLRAEKSEEVWPAAIGPTTGPPREAAARPRGFSPFESSIDLLRETASAFRLGDLSGGFVRCAAGAVPLFYSYLGAATCAAGLAGLCGASLIAWPGLLSLGFQRAIPLAAKIGFCSLPFVAYGALFNALGELGCEFVRVCCGEPQRKM